MDRLIAKTVEYGVLKIRKTFRERPDYGVDVCRQRINDPIFFSKMMVAERYQELIMNFNSHLEVFESDC